MSTEVSKTSPLTYIISSDAVGVKGDRADRVLCGFEGLPSRSQLKSWFEEGRILRAGTALHAKSKVFAGDEILVHPPMMQPSKLEARPMSLRILYEDSDLIVLYKPRGLSMHPGASRADDTTLAHALVAHSQALSNQSGEFRPGIVHRLDKDTEGIVVVAKNNETHENLSSQFEERSIQRKYWALCWGKPSSELLIDAPIGRHPKNRKKMAVTSRGKVARTRVKRLETYAEGYSWVECKLETGRTHQIRVHLSHKGFSLLKDPVYSRPKKLEWTSVEKAEAYASLKGQALVAFELGFTHPRTSQTLHFEIEKPEWLKILTSPS